MLTILLINLLFGGGSTELLAYIADTQNNVKIVMPKDARQKEALNTLKAMKKRTNARNKQERRTARDVAQAFRGHSANAAEIDAIWVNYFAENDTYNSDMLDFRFELKEHINREEWEAIFPGD